MLHFSILDFCIQLFTEDEIVAVFEEDHDGPADGAGIGLAGDADPGHQNVDKNGPYGDLQDGGNQGNAHVPHAAHEALHGVGDAGEDNGEGLHGKVGNAETDHFLGTGVRRKQLDQRVAEEEYQDADDGIVDEADEDALPEGFLYAAAVSGTPVLGSTGHHAVTDGLGRDTAVVLDLAACVEGGNDVDALHIDDALHQELADGLAGLLQRRDESAGQDFFRSS